MTDDQMCKMLEKFANDHVLATHIKVEVSHNYKSFKPRVKDMGAYYEDANLLASILTGAESFLFWLERSGYAISKKASKRAKD